MKVKICGLPAVVWSVAAVACVALVAAVSAQAPDPAKPAPRTRAADLPRPGRLVTNDVVIRDERAISSPT
jgi:hypothetical protein